MKKSTTGVTIILMLIIVALVGVYAFFAGKAKSDAEDAVMTPVQSVLNRNLQQDYPATVKEVIKYYTEIEKCLYNEDSTEEEIESLGMQARLLYDDDLLAINEVGTYLERLKADVKVYKDRERRITGALVAASTSVDTFSQDGYDFARIYCGYSLMEKGKSFTEGRVFLLRRDAKRQWKIYGWESSENVNPE